MNLILSKAYQNTYRMSEDIDIKFIEKSPNRESKSKYKKFREAISDQVINSINDTHYFEIDDKKYGDERKVQEFIIQYPKRYAAEALRPTLKLEFVQKELFQPTREFSISSIYASTFKKNAEITKINCVNLESIIAEKIIALLWRASAVANQIDIEDDAALIRHMYDVYVASITNQGYIDRVLLKTIASQSLVEHKKRHQKKYPLFNQPEQVLLHELDQIRNDKSHQLRYEDYLLPLIYSSEKPNYQTALSSLERLCNELFNIS